MGFWSLWARLLSMGALLWLARLSLVDLVALVGTYTPWFPPLAGPGGAGRGALALGGLGGPSRAGVNRTSGLRSGFKRIVTILGLCH
jgi:hypothetical protein